MPDALPAATLPIYPGLKPASRDTEMCLRWLGWQYVCVPFIKILFCFVMLAIKRAKILFDILCVIFRTRFLWFTDAQTSLEVPTSLHKCSESPVVG